MKKFLLVVAILTILIMPLSLELWGGIYWLNTQGRPQPEVDRQDRVNYLLDQDSGIDHRRILNGS